jgi:hypothetical protein
VDKIPVLRISRVANNNDAGFQIRPNHRSQVTPNNTKVMADQMSSMLIAVQSARENIDSAVGRTIFRYYTDRCQQPQPPNRSVSIDASSSGAGFLNASLVVAAFIDFPPQGA